MILNSIEKIAGDIGFDIGMSNDVVQADLLNGISRALTNSMNSSALDMQLCYVSDKLTPNSIKVIKSLYEFIKSKEENGK